MLERCVLASSAISGLEILNATTVSTAISQLSTLRNVNMAVTDLKGTVIYVSSNMDTAIGAQRPFQEIDGALSGYDVFTWNYSNGQMYSRAAAPIYSYGSLIGCVYIMEHDPEQGSLIYSLQRNIFSISLVLILLVIILSVVLSVTFSRRLRKIRSSMRIIRGGNYTHKVDIGGQDELTLLADEFNSLTSKLQTSEGRRQQFVSDASHELKTPLASIKLLTDSILQNDMDPETVKEFVGDIGNEADRLNRMSSKLLSLSKADAKLETECEIVSMTHVIDQVVRMLSIIAEKSGITIVKEIKDPCPILILEDDLYQVTYNLIENGIKYNKPGGTLTIRLYREDDNAILKIADTGIGIPEESIPQIFDRFYRVNKDRSRKSGGSGLGLSIVKSIVERNNGKINVKSTVGLGSIFTITFPVLDPEDNIT